MLLLNGSEIAGQIRIWTEERIGDHFPRLRTIYWWRWSQNLHHQLQQQLTDLIQQHQRQQKCVIEKQFRKNQEKATVVNVEDMATIEETPNNNHHLPHHLQLSEKTQSLILHTINGKNLQEIID